MCLEKGRALGAAFAPRKPVKTCPTAASIPRRILKEIIRYAQDRYVTILPEIDVPGHSLSMIVAYPNLSCTQLRNSMVTWRQPP